MQQLFGQKVLNDFIQKQDEKLIENRWQKYKNFLAKKEKISSWIETDYQDGFLEDIFENCLGYISKTRSADEHYTLEREKKNETNAQKADGALLVDDKVVAVIELKDQKTKDLDKKYNREESAVRQAFGYLQHNNHAKYVIISNFNELRFYFDKATAYEQFFLFDLDYEGFKKLHTILSYESISKNIPQTIKEKSFDFEQDISNQLYKDYTAFRTQLFENVLKNNPAIDKLELLNATQKLIDRIVFILFGEDTDLLPKNTIGTIIQKQKEVKKLVKNFTLYDSYKVYFEAINAGDEDLDITMYNGGLFAEDELLNKLVIDDEVLDARAKILSAYNFGSDISVNILGHIFENSISELEEISAQLLNNDFDKKQSKRKKDGVFYTPAYITEYIVQNTLGKLCEAKRSELNITEVEAIANPKKPTKKEQEIKDNLLIYKEWLFDLKILDPACGSGAFLNQALEYLLREHKRLQNDLALMGDLFAVYEVEKEVLEHNLYGVDINEGAVEIARLSLWLRTAKRGRPLTKLANKIKVGNSLIDDKTVVPNAFDWHAEFPEVFAQGGFDVVIGNPPYVRVQGLKSNYELEAKAYEEKYKAATGNYDIYALFLEMSFHMLKPIGKLSFILPHKFLVSDFGSGLRGFLSENKAVESLLHFGSEMVFEEASTYTCIITLSHANKNLFFKSLKPSDIFNEFEYDAISYEKLNSNKWNLSNQNVLKVLEKIKQQPLKVKDIFSRIFTGLQTSADNIYLLLQTKEGLYSKSLEQIVKVEDGLLKPILKGEDVSRYKKLSNQYFVIFPYIIENKKAKPMSEAYIQENFPKGYEYLKANEEFLRGREKGRFDNPKEWFLFSRKQGIDGVEEDKIITPDIAYKSQMSLDDGQFYHGTTLYSFIKKDEVEEDYKFYLSLFNSSLMWLFIQNTSTELRGGYFRFKTAYLEPFPLPKLKNLEQQQPFIQKADKMLELNKNLQETKRNFINELKLEKLTKKLQNFEELTFEEFVTEYTKSLKLKFADKLAERNFKQEWQAIFENDKTLTCKLKTEIAKTDKEIDKMVYELYGLSDEEIGIV